MTPPKAPRAETATSGAPGGSTAVHACSQLTPPKSTVPEVATRVPSGTTTVTPPKSTPTSAVPCDTCTVRPPNTAAP